MPQKAHPLRKKRVLVLGLGLSGQSAANFLLQRGAVVVGADSNRELLSTHPKIAELQSRGMEITHDSQAWDCSGFDLIVVSPGIPSTHPCCSQAHSLGIEVIGEVELACRELRDQSLSRRCVAVTGTNGKTTVTSLVAHVLNSAGQPAKALGNVGIPLTSAFDAEAETAGEIFVIELSSFQLETLHCAFIDAGVILNITPDHLDRYHSMTEYALAKVRMKDNLKSGGKLFVEEKCLQEYRRIFGNGRFISYGYAPACYIYTDTQHVYVGGEMVFALPAGYRHKRSHDVENLMAAFMLCHEMGLTAEQFLHGLQSFQKPAHRIEFVRAVAGVNYYDDSKGTNIDAVMRAVDSIEGNIVLIAGGIDKGTSYTPWLAAFAGKVKAVCVIGQAAENIQKDLGQHISVEHFESLDAAVRRAACLTNAGETVLLSPGCSSFDMFKDYAHRGQEFQRIVRAL